MNGASNLRNGLFLLLWLNYWKMSHKGYEHRWIRLVGTSRPTKWNPDPWETLALELMYSIFWYIKKNSIPGIYSKARFRSLGYSEIWWIWVFGFGIPLISHLKTYLILVDLFLNQHETVARSRPSDSNSSGSSVSQSNISSSLNSSSSLPPPMAIFRSLPRPNKSKMTTSDEVKINAKTSLEV